MRRNVSVALLVALAFLAGATMPGFGRVAEAQESDGVTAVAVQLKSVILVKDGRVFVCDSANEKQRLALTTRCKPMTLIFE
jgi:hypothetical protein